MVGPVCGIPIGATRTDHQFSALYRDAELDTPECGSDMRILALPSATSASFWFLTDPERTGAILRHLDLPHTPPRLSPAGGPPQPAFEAETVPELDLDQTRCA